MTTITKFKAAGYSCKQAVPFTLLLDSSYPTGGELVVPSGFGLQTLDMILFGVCVDSGGVVLIPSYNPATGAVHVAYPSGGDASAPTTVAQPGVVTTPDAGGTTVTGSAAKPALAGVVTPGGGKQVGSTANLAGYTIYGIAFGN